MYDLNHNWNFVIKNMHYFEENIKGTITRTSKRHNRCGYPGLHYFALKEKETHTGWPEMSAVYFMHMIGW